MDRNKILEIIYRSVKKINENRQKNKLQLKESTVLFGEAGTLDSLDLVSLIVDVEQQLLDSLKIKISLTDEKAMSQKNSPFKSVKSLADYIAGNIDKKSNI